VRLREGILSSVAVPIYVNGRLWGMIAVGSGQARLPHDTEQRMAEFTDLVATAVANAQNLAELITSRARIVTASDQARRRIERDLHDGAQQRLVSLALQLRSAGRASPSPEAEELATQMDLMAEELTGALDELREIARGIHPAALAEGGLRPALKALARRFAVPVRLDVGVDERLPEPIELAAYYVVAEALTNTAKHADASVVDVRAESGEGILQILVRDNGRGGADIARGTGLIGLTDRVEALGGRLSLYSPPGVGTTMQVALPLTAPGASGSSAAVTGRPDHSGRDQAIEPEPSGPAQGS
jgi:signal transduction histidine kinase